jgi:pilus assembly protein FimV
VPPTPVREPPAFGVEPPASGLEPRAPATEPRPLSAELPAFDFEPPPAGNAAPPVAAIAPELAADAEAAASGGRIDLAQAGADLQFELDRTAKPGGTALDLPLPEQAPAIDLDALDLSFPGGSHAPGSDATLTASGQWHDAATKLDLAKAYQEMGDVEGAREILREVLHEGDDQQKAEAAALIAKLG